MSTTLTKPKKTARTRRAVFDATIAAEAFRSSQAEVDEENVKVSDAGGRFAGGVLYGVSLISAGEALGHEMWIDDVAVGQVAELAANDEHGLKSRFTHPSMSTDGLGRHLGRIFGSEQDGSKVVGDLHFASSAHDTPDGDLADYVMQLATEDPQAAGLSIVFDRSLEMEHDFLLMHGAEVTADGWLDTSKFISPDEDNVENFPHVRVAALAAADIVDQPAANPDGLFDRQPEARNVDAFLAYALGVSTDRPDSTQFGVDPDRASQFISRWLETHSLSLTPTKDDPDMTTDAPAADVVEQPTREDYKAESLKFREAFGLENGTKWFDDDTSYDDALRLHCDALQATNKELQASNDELQKRLDDVTLGEADPIDVTGSPKEGEAKKRTFVETTARPSNN
jgi:hypothetical protein